MIMVDKMSNKDMRKGMDIFSECLAGMFYSDEEIREMLSPEDADEYIELRNNLLASQSSSEIGLDKYVSDEHSMPLAAEDEESYK